MEKKLEKIMEDNKNTLVGKISNELKNSNSKNYKRLTLKKIKERVEKLYNALLRSVIEKNYTIFIDFVEDVTLKRIDEGFGLEDIQKSLTSLEKNTWKVIVDEASINDVVKYLGIITSITGEGKDHIARIFLTQKNKIETFILDLQKNHKNLFEDIDLANILS